MKKQMINPYLPSWEYVPDGEPYVFGDRVYVYGSHDRFNGWVFCQNDYICWSAPVTDLSDWRYEGVIYRKEQDPRNRDGHQCLYAPDVTVGPDGRYYLYYVLDKENIVSVAVCDTPAGEYQFLGYVHDKDGGILGERPGDEAQFDPGLLTEGDRTYLYTGFCWGHDASRHGAMATVLGPDMLTILEEPVFVAPSGSYSQGTGYEDHEYFEAASIRKVNGKYYFIYSSVKMCELCYAVSDHPTHGFRFGGCIVANDDFGISSYKPAGKRMYFTNNNHGSIIEIEGQWYIFYHRPTNGTSFSRQGCIEKITILPDGRIPQVETTSCCGTPLQGKGEIPAYIACNIFRKHDDLRNAGGRWMDGLHPKITQDGRDGDQEQGFLCNLGDGWAAAYKYFDCKGVKALRIRTRGYARGNVTLRLAWDGEPIVRIPVVNTNIWTDSPIVPIDLPDGIHGLYIGFEGDDAPSLHSFTLYTEDMLKG